MKLRFAIIALAMMCLCCVSKKTLTPHYEQYGHLADSIFSINKDRDTFNFNKFFENKEGERAYVTLKIGNLFNDRQRHALILYSINDSVFQIKVLEKEKSEWKTLKEKSLVYYFSLPFIDNITDFYDLNGDGQKELLVMTGYADLHIAEFYHGFALNGHIVNEIKGLEEYPNPEFDGTGKISSYRSSGCADMAMYFQEARIDQFKVTKLKDVLCDCCMDSITGDSCEIQIDNEKPFRVKSSEAANFVPKSYYESVKEKVEMND